MTGVVHVLLHVYTPRAARGRPRKESESPSEPPSSSPLVQRANPERAARDRVLDSNVTAETPEKEDISQVSSSQAHILDVLELMGCKEHESSVRRLPHIDNRCQVVNASEADIDATAMQRVDNVFLRGVKAWIHLLAPLSDLDYTLRDELHFLCTDVYTFLNYGYAVQLNKCVSVQRVGWGMTHSTLLYHSK